MRVKSSAD